MKNVLDVSAAFAIIIGAPASRHFLPEVESATQVLAPDLFYSEATNAAWKFHHIEELSPGESLKLAERAIQLVDIFIPSETLWKEAFELACISPSHLRLLLFGPHSATESHLADNGQARDKNSQSIGYPHHRPRRTGFLIISDREPSDNTTGRKRPASLLENSQVWSFASAPLFS